MVRVTDKVSPTPIEILVAITRLPPCSAIYPVR
jgi:hypothetical protein